MVWLLIALVVGAVVLTLIFTSSIEETWLLGYAAFIAVAAFILAIIQLWSTIQKMYGMAQQKIDRM